MIGQQIDKYKIISLLGEGAMGIVYKAMDVDLERIVALKLMNARLSHNPELDARFRSEARTQATLNHHNIATLYSFLTWEGKAVMVMEYVEGKTLQEMITNYGALPASTALALCKQALYGVGAAHKQGIVHRDLKPANLMLSNEGVIKVMDFGIAKVKGGGGLKGTSMAIGTYDYMAPEQALNQVVDARTDIYSMGITLYEMLTGEVPFKFDSEFAVQLAHQNQRPVNPMEHNPAIPKEVADIVLRALEKNPDDRFASTDEFIRAMPRLSEQSAQPNVQTKIDRGTVIDTGGFVAPGSSPGISISAPGQPTQSNQQPGFNQTANNSGATHQPSVAKPRKNSGVAIGAAAIVIVAIALIAVWIIFKPKQSDLASNKPVPVAPKPGIVDPPKGPGHTGTIILPPKLKTETESSKPVVLPPGKVVPEPVQDVHPPKINPVPDPVPPPDDGLIGAWMGSYLDSASQETTTVNFTFRGTEENLSGTADFKLSDNATGECSVSGTKYDPAKRVLTLLYTSCKGAKPPAYLHSPTIFGDVDWSAKTLKNGHVLYMTTVNAAFAKHGF